jgi:DNA transformation protein
MHSGEENMAEIKDAFVSHVLDLLQTYGPVRAKAMFGGYGLYHQGLMFALITEGTLYVKADDENRSLFEAEALQRFSYMKQGREYFMSYYTLPEAAMDDPEELKHWAAEGYAAARRAHTS